MKRGDKVKDRFVFKCVLEKEGKLYNALCLDLDISSYGVTVEEAKANLEEAITLYLEYAFETNRFEELVPRPVPPHVMAKYKNMSKKKIGQHAPKFDCEFFRSHDHQFAGC